MKRTWMYFGRCLAIAVLLCAAAAGCRRGQNAGGASDAPQVVVCQPVVKDITDYEDFTGRTEAVASVEVRARVTGYLERVLFREGAEVRQGDLLFEIDPRTYQAELKRTEAALLQAESRLKSLQSEHQRAVTQLASKTIPQNDFQKIDNERDEAEAAVKLAEAARDAARLNLSFAQIAAPISGRIGRLCIDPGNLVRADETPLAAIVAVDPIYVYFDQDERTMLRIRRMIRTSKTSSSQEVSLPVFMGLMSEEGHPHEGRINFVDNRVDLSTGTLRMRGVFANPKGLLPPGLFARIRVPIGTPHSAILVSEQALGNNQGQKFVYVVNEQNEVEYRPVKPGAVYGSQIVIEEGLTPKDRVILNGPQHVRPGMQVEAKLADAQLAAQSQ